MQLSFFDGPCRRLVACWGRLCCGWFPGFVELGLGLGPLGVRRSGFCLVRLRRHGSASGNCFELFSGIELVLPGLVAVLAEFGDHRVDAQPFTEHGVGPFPLVTAGPSTHGVLDATERRQLVVGVPRQRALDRNRLRGVWGFFRARAPARR
ncbi:hypothetical protein [Rhodococcus sp. ACT016]|uniref:hypothetical protein n=1 Tax=Rhodococcus sp. ACT016 TaxID=3134808 RepID=UPI003D2BC5E6